MSNKCYMAIDPGSKGFIVTQCNGDFSFYSIADNDLHQLAKIIENIRLSNANLVCIMEQIHAIFGSSAKATFSFGEIYGQLQGLLIANKIPYILVQPKEWQKEIWTNSDMVINYKKTLIIDKKTREEKEITRKEVDTKNTSINAAKRLFPHIDFRKSDRCKNLDDNKVDATLMAEYARRKNL